MKEATEEVGKERYAGSEEVEQENEKFEVESEEQNTDAEELRREIGMNERSKR